LKSVRRCEERSDEAIQSFRVASGLLRGACHRAALRADPLARNDASEPLISNAAFHAILPYCHDDAVNN
jgi:hypothetical protein